MDDVRKSFSDLKKNFKHRLRGKKRAPDREGVHAAGEMANSSASFLQPDSRATASGHSEEGGRIGTDISQARSRDPSPQPELVSADEDRRDDPQRKEADVGEKEDGQGDSRLDPDAEVAAGSGSNREDKRAHSPLPVTSIPPKQESDGTWALSPQPLRLIIPLHNTGTPAVPDHMQKELRPDENAESNAAASEKTPSWKSTAYATAKLLLRGCLWSAQVCRWRSLFYSGKLRGTVFSTHTPSGV